jgi:hypothetical protein
MVPLLPPGPQSLRPGGGNWHLDQAPAEHAQTESEAEALRLGAPNEGEILYFFSDGREDCGGGTPRPPVRPLPVLDLEARELTDWAD